jgi:uncharacterized protein (DUF58 family)
MFDTRWLYAALFILLAGLVSRQAALVAVAALLLLAAGVAWLWNRYSLAGVHYERLFSERRVFPGEQVTMTVRVVNRKLLPLAWLSVVDEFPSRLPLLKGKLGPSGKPLVGFLSHLVSMRWYERVSWRYAFRAEARGYYPFGPLSLRSGDAFGFFETTQTVEQVDHLVVYPRIVPLESLGLPLKQPFGETRSRERIFEDVSRTVGVRDWQQGDEQRHIHWKATARRQALQVRVFEPTATLNVAIFLNVLTFAHVWEGVDTALLERAITVAASLASFAAESRYLAGLYANTSLPNSDQPIRIPPSRNPEQMALILDALAKVTPFAITPLENLLVAEAGRLPWGATLVIVSAVWPEELLSTILKLRDAGHRLVVTALDESVNAETLAGVPVWRVAGDVSP